MPKTSSYTVHGHMKNRDGTLSAFWTRTRLSKAQAQKLAKEQRAEPGGVAEIVVEDPENSPPAYGKPGDPPPAKIYDIAVQKWIPDPKTKRHHATRKKSSAQLDREIAEALHGGSSPEVNLQYDDSEIEQMFKKSGGSEGSKGTLAEHAKTVTAILGDPMYAREFKMPKWSRRVTVLDTPDVAIRHWSELGIPRSKNAHAGRADYFRDLRSRFETEHARLINEGEQAYGTNGPVISGGFHRDWPEALKDRIRFLAHGSTMLSAATRLHEALSKSRSPVFQ